MNQGSDPDTVAAGRKRACVIGAGPGGLALAIRLQAGGVDTVLVEARERAGGRAGGIERDGYRFAAGPSLIAEPAWFEALWGLAGRTMADDIALLPVAPMARFSWTDGASFDLVADPVAQRTAIARLSPSDVPGYEEFIRHSAAVLAERRARPGAASLKEPRALGRALPALARAQAWRSFDGLVGRFLREPHLRQAFSAGALFEGADPFAPGAASVAGHARDSEQGLWAPEGGMGALADAMLRLFERLGGTVRLHDPVLHVHVLGDRANEVETVSGWRERFDAVASNADAVHTWRALLAGSPRSREVARRLAARPQSPGVFAVHFGLEGGWPGIPHQSVLFGPRWEGLVRDIFEHGVLPADMAIWLHHPSVTDPSLAPAGKSVFSAFVPVAHQGKLPIDWETVGPMLEARVIDEIGRRLVPDIRDRITVCFHRTPRDLGLDFNAFLGSAFGPAAGIAPAAWPMLRARDERVRNLYFAGAALAPGAGLAGAVRSAAQTAAIMLEDLSK